jgi:hypothetical protein
VIVNVADEVPARTVTLAGTVAAAVLSLARVTGSPPAGATPDSVTVPAADTPPMTLVGLIETEETGAARIVSGADCVTPEKVPEIVAGVVEATAVVVTVNVFEDVPAVTVTLAGTVAAVLELESVTVAPPVGAAPVRVTVPVEATPPVRLAGFTVTDRSAAGSTVSDAVRVAPP